MRRNTQPSGVLSLGGGGQTAQSQGGEREGTACPAPASLSHAPRGVSSINPAPASLSHAPQRGPPGPPRPSLQLRDFPDRPALVQVARRPQGTGRLSVPKATATGRPRSCSPTGRAPAHSGSAAASSHLCFTRAPSSGPWPFSPPASCPPGACCHPGSLHQACALLLPMPRHRPHPES